jgi:hypothetical protein
MSHSTLAILSDIHYASAPEQARGNEYEIRGISNPLLKTFVSSYRYFIWQREPLKQNYLLDQFLSQVSADYAVANGDYSCNSGFVGVSDEAACQSAHECLEKLRAKFGTKLRATFGDHELGKLSFFGAQGGMRLASWRRARQELGLEPFWRMDAGRYVLLGVTSSLIALPVFEPDTLPEEREQWRQLRQEHLSEIKQTFSSIQRDQTILLFCHDPTALPFLWHEPEIRSKIPLIERTIIGHLHSNLIFWKSRLLAGMPRIGFLGHTTKRLSAALREARHWKPFKVLLCPALGGLELTKSAGYLMADVDLENGRPARFEYQALTRKKLRSNPQG